jgi:hypothetical protein
MSGHKRTTITLSQEEYRKLHEAEMRLRIMNEGIQDEITQTRKELNRELQTEIDSMQFRQNTLIENLNQVNQEISNIEENTSQLLIDQHLSLQDDFARAISDYHINAETALASLESNIHIQLNELLTQHDQQWKWITDEWQLQADGQKSKLHLAQEWIRAATVLEQFIIENYDHERYSPGSIQRFDNRLNQAQNDLALNMPEAAVVTAQEAYNKFSELRIELEKMQVEYQLLLKTVQLKGQNIQALLRNNMVVPAIDLEGNPLPYNITVNHWSNDELELLSNEFASIMAEMVDTSQPADSKELQRLINDYFPYVEDKVADIVLFARMKVINAQLRMNIAEIVVQALGGQGYSLSSSYFITEDERDAYQANLINYEGSQVIVKVDPIEEETAANELHLFTSDAQQKTSHELNQRALEIKRALLLSGLKVGTITATRKTPDPAIFYNSYNENQHFQKKRNERKQDTTKNETHVE